MASTGDIICVRGYFAHNEGCRIAGLVLGMAGYGQFIFLFFICLATLATLISFSFYFSFLSPFLFLTHLSSPYEAPMTSRPS